jgi:hypothetical protein
MWSKGVGKVIAEGDEIALDKNVQISRRTPERSVP